MYYCVFFNIGSLTFDVPFVFFRVYSIIISNTYMHFLKVILQNSIILEEMVHKKLCFVTIGLISIYILHKT